MRAVTIHDRVPGNGLAFDLVDVLRLAERDVASSSWRCRNVECGGDLADELHRVSDYGAEVSGSDMLRQAGGVYQVIDGDFEAYRVGEARTWLVVRAVDSSEFVVITGDETLLERIRQRFRDVRDSPDDAAHVA